MNYVRISPPPPSPPKRWILVESSSSRSSRYQRYRRSGKFHERQKLFIIIFPSTRNSKNNKRTRSTSTRVFNEPSTRGDDGQAQVAQDRGKAGQEGKSNFVISDTFEGSQLCTRPVPVISLKIYQAVVPAFSYASCNNLIVESRRNSVRASMGIEERGQGRRITRFHQTSDTIRHSRLSLSNTRERIWNLSNNPEVRRITKVT